MSVTVDASVAPAGPSARGIQGSTGIHPVHADLVSRGTMRAGQGREARLSHSGRLEEVCDHRVFPRTPGDRLDRAPEQAPTGIRVGPHLDRLLLGHGSRRKPREHVVVALRVRDIELELCAKRKPRAIGEKVAHGGALCPARSAQFRHARRDRIVQRKAARTHKASNHRRDHRLHQRPDRETGIRSHRLARPRIRDAVRRNRHIAVAENPDRRPGHRMPSGMLAEKSFQLEPAHEPQTRHRSAAPTATRDVSEQTGEVELDGLEPSTSTLPAWRSPS